MIKTCAVPLFLLNLAMVAGVSRAVRKVVAEILA